MPLSNADAAFVQDHLLKVSRTFAPGIAQLDDELRDGVGVAYLLCRILDTIEDSAHLDHARRVALLEQASALRFSQGIEGIHGAEPFIAAVEAFFHDEDNDDGLLCRESSRVFSSLMALPSGQQAAIEGGFCEMARGMALFLNRVGSAGDLKIRSFADLREYCYFVAGTVGEILSRLFIETRSYDADLAASLTSRDVAFGIGLQIVNILKGVKADAQRSAQFVPEDLLDQESVSLLAVLEDDSSHEAHMVALGLVKEAFDNLKEAAAYSLMIPIEDQDIRAFCAFPILLALRTCALALHSNAVFPEDNALRVARPEVEAMLKNLPQTISSNEALSAAFEAEFAPIEKQLAETLPSP